MTSIETLESFTIGGVRDGFKNMKEKQKEQARVATENAKKFINYLSSKGVIFPKSEKQANIAIAKANILRSAAVAGLYGGLAGPGSGAAASAMTDTSTVKIGPTWVGVSPPMGIPTLFFITCMKTNDKPVALKISTKRLEKMFADGHKLSSSDIDLIISKNNIATK